MADDRPFDTPVLSRRGLLATGSLMATAALLEMASPATAAAAMARKSNRVLAREYYLTIDRDGLLAGKEYVAATSRSHIPNHTGMVPAPGENLGRIYYTAFPDFTHAIIDQIAEGDLVVQRIRYFATHLGPYMGIAATGRKISFTGMDWVRFDPEGKVVERWGMADEFDIRRQLLGDYTAAQVTQSNKQLAGDVYAVIDRWNIPASAVFANGPSRMHGPQDQDLGRHTFWYTAFPDFTHDIQDQVAEGDAVVQRIRYFGTHKDWFLGVGPTGRKITLTGMDWTKFKDFKSTERWGVSDNIGLRRQLLGQTIIPPVYFEQWPWMVRAFPT